MGDSDCCSLHVLLLLFYFLLWCNRLPRQRSFISSSDTPIGQTTIPLHPQQWSLNHKCPSILSNTEIPLFPMAFVLMHWCAIDGNSAGSSDKLKCQPCQRWGSPLLATSLRWGWQAISGTIPDKMLTLTHTNKDISDGGSCIFKGNESSERTQGG